MPHLHPPWWAQAPSRAGQEVPRCRAPEDVGGTGRPGTTRSQADCKLPALLYCPGWVGAGVDRERGMALGFKLRREWSPQLESLQEPPSPHPLPRAPTLFCVISQLPQPLSLPSASSHLPSPCPAWWLPTAPYPPLSNSYLLTPACPSLSYFRFPWLPQRTLGSVTPAPPHLLALRAHTQ